MRSYYNNSEVVIKNTFLTVKDQDEPPVVWPYLRRSHSCDSTLHPQDPCSGNAQGDLPFLLPLEYDSCSSPYHHLRGAACQQYSPKGSMPCASHKETVESFTISAPPERGTNLPTLMRTEYLKRRNSGCATSKTSGREGKPCQANRHVSDPVVGDTPGLTRMHIAGHGKDPNVSGIRLEISGCTNAQTRDQVPRHKFGKGPETRSFANSDAASTGQLANHGMLATGDTSFSELGWGRIIEADSITRQPTDSLDPPSHLANSARFAELDVAPRRSSEPVMSSTRLTEVAESISSPSSWVESTTLMMHVGPKYTQTSLLEDLEDAGYLPGMVDFIYMPFHFIRRSNQGYAFINFSTPSLAEGFVRQFAARPFGRYKTEIRIKLADRQGKEANIERLRRTSDKIYNTRYLPMVFDGERMAPLSTSKLSPESPSSILSDSPKSMA